MTDNSNVNLPKVSVIVPCYNNRDCIGKLIESLLAQDYPKELFEIIVIDNNSSDQTVQIIQNYPVTLLHEKEIQSSYAARNRGIEKASGQVLAFIDADCQAFQGWLTEGIKALQQSGSDFVGGKVEFILSDNKTVGQMYDSITHFDFEKSISEKRGTGAGNLFVRREVFNEVGLFPEDVKSGGDYQWTKSAIEKGCVLVYGGHAIVTHPARRLNELLRKRFRTAKGTLKAWHAAGLSSGIIFSRVLRMALPRRWSMIKKAIKERGTDDMNDKMLGLFLVAYLCNLVSLCGIVISLFTFSKTRN